MGPDSGPSDAFARSQLGTQELEWIASLPFVRRFSDEVLLCHGSPTSDCAFLLQTAERNATAEEVAQRLGQVDAAVVLCGHSHVPRSVRSGGVLVVNPGSVGLGAYDDEHPYPHLVETGSPDARYALLERLAHGWAASLVSVPYRHEDMARLAAERGRPDWERALMTGYMK